MHIGPNVSWPMWDDLLVIDDRVVPTADIVPHRKHHILLNVLFHMRLFLQEHFAYRNVETADLATIEAELRECVVTTMGVVELMHLRASISPSVRLLAVSFACDTVAGLVRYTGPVMAQTSVAGV